MKSTNYPEDWYTYLKKGDIVKCILTAPKDMFPYRTPQKEYVVDKDSTKYGSIHYSPTLTATRNKENFIPIKMQAFPLLNNSKDAYEIY